MELQELSKRIPPAPPKHYRKRRPQNKPSSTSISKKTTTSEIKRLGNELAKDINDSSNIQNTWLVLTSSTNTNILSEVHRRILVLNQQALETMNQNNFSIAEQLFKVIEQLLKSNTNEENSKQQPFISLTLTYYNNRACLCRKMGKLQTSTEYLKSALEIARKIKNKTRRSAEILPVLCNLACVASLRQRHLEAVSFAARSVLITMAIDEREKKEQEQGQEQEQEQEQDSVKVPEETRICCFWQLGSQIEHLGSVGKKMVGNVYSYAYDRSIHMLGKHHSLTKQLKKATKEKATTHPPIFGFNMAKLTASIMKMYGVQNCTFKRKRCRRNQKRQRSSTSAKSMSNLHRRYGTIETNKLRRPISAGRHRVSPASVRSPREQPQSQSQSQSKPQSRCRQRPSSATPQRRDNDFYTHNKEVPSPTRLDITRNRPTQPTRPTRPTRPTSAPFRRKTNNASLRRRKVRARKIPNHGQHSVHLRSFSSPSQAPYKHPQRPTPKPRTRTKPLTIQQREEMHKASKRVHQQLKKNLSIKKKEKWPPDFMKEKFRKLLQNTPNPTEYIEAPTIPTAVERPTIGSVFISDFQIPGWQNIKSATRKKVQTKKIKRQTQNK